MTTPPQPPRADDDPQPPLQDDAATLLAIPGSRRGSGSTPFAPGGGGHHTTRALAESFPFQRGEHLGSGGIGEVYSARDRRLSREVAIKTLQRNHTAEARARFLREARITARLEHPNIVPVHELMEDPDGNLSLVMKVV
ncbi:MAG: protein kinase, partial [Planctomycetota bacterium]